MPHRLKHYTNFSRAINTHSNTIRPDNERHIGEMMVQHQHTKLLARGHGLSYSDSCVLDQGTLMDTSRLNHLLSFDPVSGLAVCQGGATFASLWQLHPDFIPPVIPGTLHATLAGGVAHDVHGKNNHQTGSLGHHIEWLDMQIGEQSIHCNRQQHSDLFYATIAGLGLTGVIKRMGLHLRRASRWVNQKTIAYTQFENLLNDMQHLGIQSDYQVAWLDLLNKPRALLTLANHTEHSASCDIKRTYRIPNIPLRLVHRSLMKQFNRIHFYQANQRIARVPLWQFNNPLDQLTHWNRLYGRHGLLQFQAVFDQNHAHTTLNQLIETMRSHQATATLAVLKYFTQKGAGLLSFVQPGFTIAIDFIHNQASRSAIDAMNQIVTALGGKVYLAKDLRLTSTQFRAMYHAHDTFQTIMADYHSPMCSDLSKRLELNR